MCDHDRQRVAKDKILLWGTVAALAFAAYTAIVLLGGCADTWTGPVTPVTPPGPVVPVDPPAPVDPPQPAQVVPYAAAHSILPGWTWAQVEAAVGFPAALVSRQDDQTEIRRWPALGATGAPRWLDVQADAGGLVIGHVLIPRATR